MSISNTQVQGLPPRCKQRKPRKLSYKKCHFCRDRKVKSRCVWDRGPWPNKCQRCSKKGLSCSEPCHKAEEHLSNPPKPLGPSLVADHSVSTALNIPPVCTESERPVLSLSGVICLHDEPGTPYKATTPSPQLNVEEKDRLVLQLLSIHGMILLVMEEIKSLVRELLIPLISKDTSGHSDYRTTGDVYSEFQYYAKEVGQVIEKLTPHSNVAMEAALDLTSWSFLPQLPLAALVSERLDYLQEVELVKNVYAEKGHVGMVILLTMYQSTVENPYVEFEGSSMDIQLSEINTFIEQCIVDFEEYEIDPRLLRLLGSFTPTRSIQFLPSLWSRLRERGGSDLLNRSVPLLEYDAGLPVAEADILYDAPDCLGRTILHVSCLRNDEQMIETLLAKGLICDTKTESGLSPLHIVAITGNLKMFKKLHDFYMSDTSMQKSLEAGPNSEAVLQLAARHGNSGIIHFYLSTHKFTTEYFERSYPDIHTDDHFLNLDGNIKYEAAAIMLAFKEALRYDREEVVRVLCDHSRYPIWDWEERTPLWYASHYGRLNAVDMLFRQGYMKKPDCLGYTPLMAAAAAGHEKVLNRLCSLGGHLIGNANSATPSKNFLGLGLVDRWGMTARDLAVSKGHPECAKILDDLMNMASMTLP